MKKAKALMGRLSTAAAAAAADDLEKTDPQKDAFDALFGGGYAMPNDDDLDLRHDWQSPRTRPSPCIARYITRLSLRAYRLQCG